MTTRVGKWVVMSQTTTIGTSEARTEKYHFKGNLYWWGYLYVRYYASGRSEIQVSEGGGADVRCQGKEEGR